MFPLIFTADRIVNRAKDGWQIGIEDFMSSRRRQFWFVSNRWSRELSYSFGRDVLCTTRQPSSPSDSINDREIWELRSSRRRNSPYMFVTVLSQWELTICAHNICSRIHHRMRITIFTYKCHLYIFRDVFSIIARLFC